MLHFSKGPPTGWKEKLSKACVRLCVLVSELWDIYLALLAVLPRFQLQLGGERRANDSGGGGKTV